MPELERGDHVRIINRLECRVNFLPPVIPAGSTATVKASEVYGMTDKASVALDHGGHVLVISKRHLEKIEA